MGGCVTCYRPLGDREPAHLPPSPRTDVFTTQLAYGYDTSWAYFHERDQALASGATPGELTITDETMQRTLSLSMPCCSFSVAKLVAAYPLVMGVSGTIPEAGSGEDQMLRLLGIEERYQQVDIYNNPNSENVFNKSSAGPDRGVVIADNLASQVTNVLGG